MNERRELCRGKDGGISESSYVVIKVPLVVAIANPKIKKKNTDSGALQLIADRDLRGVTCERADSWWL